MRSSRCIPNTPDQRPYDPVFQPNPAPGAAVCVDAPKTSQCASVAAIVLHRRADGRLREMRKDKVLLPNTTQDMERVLCELRCNQVGLERTRSQLDLRESDEKYRRVYDSMMDAFARVDLAGWIQYTNPAFRALLGYTEEELAQLTYRDLSPEKWHAFEADIINRQILVEGGSDVYEKEYRKKDGTVFPVELRTFLVRDVSGHPIGMGAIVRDITQRKQAERALQQARDDLDARVAERTAELVTAYEELNREGIERKRAEDALRESEARFRAIADYSYDWENWVSPTGELIWTNSAVERITGYTRQEYLELRSRLKRVIYDEDWEQASASFESALAYRLSDNDRPLRIRHKDGSIRWVSLSYQPSYADNGDYLGLRSSIRDITDRKQAEDALALSEALLAKAEDVAHAGSFDWDLRTNTIKWSLGMHRVLGLSPETSRDDPDLPFRLIHPDDSEWMLAIKKSLFGGATIPAELECRIVCEDGAVRRILLRNEISRDESGAALRVIGTILDVTERRDLEERLRQSEKLDAIGQLAGGIAHDFNNVLGSILGYADLLVGQTTEGTSQRRFAETIALSAHRAADLTSQLLRFGRKSAYVLAPVDLHNTVAEVVGLLEHFMDRKIVIELALKADRATVCGDVSQLTNVFLNLALNARDAMPNGGMLRFGSEIVECDEARCRELSPEMVVGQYVAVSVSDTGEGMNQATMQRIFEPFFTTKPAGKGLGMGLASVYDTLRLHAGAITVSSEVNCGATFTVFLPLSESREDPTVPVGQPRCERGSARVLVVDDEEHVRLVLSDMLRAMGYEVTVCTTGIEALELYKTSPKDFDVIVLDMIMPGLSGKDTLVRLREFDSHVKVLLSSGYTMDGDVQTILNTGEALGFLQKPYTSAELSHQIQEVLAADVRLQA